MRIRSGNCPRGGYISLSVIGILARGKATQKQKQKCAATMNCTSNLVAHIALVSKQPLWLAALRTLPFILPDELNVARLFGNDGGLTMLSFDPKAKSGRFSDGDNDSDSDSGSDSGSDSDSTSCGAAPVPTAPARAGWL